MIDYLIQLFWSAFFYIINATGSALVEVIQLLFSTLAPDIVDWDDTFDKLEAVNSVLPITELVGVTAIVAPVVILIYSARAIKTAIPFW
jgi:hypothetical protein